MSSVVARFVAIAAISAAIMAGCVGHPIKVQLQVEVPPQTLEERAEENEDDDR